MRKPLDPHTLVAYLTGANAKPVAVAELRLRESGAVETSLNFEATDGPELEREYALRFRVKLMQIVEAVDLWASGRHTQEGSSRS